MNLFFLFINLPYTKIDFPPKNEDLSFVAEKFHHEKCTDKGCGKGERSDINNITEESFGTKQGRFVYKDHFKLSHNHVVTLVGHSTKGILRRK